MASEQAQRLEITEQMLAAGMRAYEEWERRCLSGDHLMAAYVRERLLPTVYRAMLCAAKGDASGDI